MLKNSQRGLRRQVPTAYDLTAVLQGVARGLEAQTGGPEIPTGIQVLDKECLGLHKGHIVTIGGRPGDGKTSIMLQVALGLAKNGIKTTLISLEMTAEQVLERMMALEMEIDMFSIRSLPSGNIPPRVFDGLGEFAKKLSAFKEHLHIIDDFGYTTDEMTRLFDDIYENKPQVVLVDHLQHIRCDNRRTLEAIDDYLLTVKEFAKKNNICFVILSQVNRQGSEKPTLAHLKSSGKIEEISDCIILIDRNKLAVDQNNCKLIIAKQRYGPVGEHEVYFCGAYTKFFNNYQDYLDSRTIKVKTISLAKDFKTYISMGGADKNKVTGISYKEINHETVTENDQKKDVLDNMAEQWRD